MAPARISSTTRRSPLARVPRVAHLGGDLVPGRRLGQHPGLVDRMGERLLAVDVLAQVECGLGDHGVRVVGRADDHRVDLPVQLVEHPAEVVVGLRPGMPFAASPRRCSSTSQRATMFSPATDLRLSPRARPRRRGRCSASSERLRPRRKAGTDSNQVPSPRACERTGDASMEGWSGGR